MPIHESRADASERTMKKPLDLLLVEDSEEDALLVLRELRRGGFEVQSERVDTQPDMSAALKGRRWDLVISDYSMPGFDAPGALQVVKELGCDIPVIIVSGTVGEEHAVAALRAGAADFVLKDKLARLLPAVERELREKAERDAKRRAETRAAESENRYRAMFEACPLPMWVYDKGTLAFIAVNEAAVHHYGHSREEFAKLTLAEIRPKEDVAAFREDAARIKGRRDRHLVRHCKKNGAVTMVEVNSRDFSLDGRSARLVVANDVTDRMRLEEQLRRAQKMEAIGGVAGGVAHDFNNLLSVILSYGRLLRDGFAPTDPVRADLEEICKAGDRAADLTRQLLAFSRQQTLDPRVIDVNQIVGGMERMLRRLLGEDIQLAFQCAQHLDTIRADPGQVEQVVMNLAVNARDAMPRGGKLSIETENVRLGADNAEGHHDVTPGGYVMIAITDTGTGMDAATQERIFEPFFTTKEKGKGTGLGLSTVFGIVKQSGGHVWVFSEPGKGTTFKVYFPRSDAVLEAAPKPTVAPPTLRGSETVLLVEDEEQVRTLMRTILRRRGYSVLEAQNGGEAILICDEFEGDIQLLVTDVVMPRVGGPELAKRLLRMRPAMKVLYVSGYTDRSFVRDGTITPDAFARRVREVLDSAAGERRHRAKPDKRRRNG